MPSIWRKFTSQTSDSVDGWKSRGGKRQRRERKKEEKKSEKRWKNKMQVGEKVENRKTLFFPMFCGSQSRLTEVEKLKIPRSPRSFGRLVLETASATWARRACRSQNVQGTALEPFGRWAWKKCTQLEAHFGVKILLELRMSKECEMCARLWREAHVEVKI